MEGCGFEGEVVSCDHQCFEVDRIGNVVGEEGFEGSEATAGGILVPEEDGGVAIEAVEFTAVQAKRALTCF